MKKYQTHNVSDVIRTAASMLLFLIFAVSMLIIIAVAADTYSRISEGFDREFNSSAAVRYLGNKIRSADSVEIIENGDGAALTSGKTVCIIYCKDGSIYEKTVLLGEEVKADDGDRIFDMDNIDLSMKNGLVYITAELADDSSSAVVRGR